MVVGINYGMESKVGSLVFFLCYFHAKPSLPCSERSNLVEPVNLTTVRQTLKFQS